MVRETIACSVGGQAACVCSVSAIVWTGKDRPAEADTGSQTLYKNKRRTIPPHHCGMREQS